MTHGRDQPIVYFIVHYCIETSDSVINQTGEYALRAVVFLGQRSSDQAVSAQEISDGTKVPVGYLQKILRMLSRAGLLSAQRGTGGGFALTKLPSAISILEVLKAVDASVTRIERCPLGIKGHTKLCALHCLIDAQLANTERVFASTSIQDILSNLAENRPLCEQRPAAVEVAVLGRMTRENDSEPNP